MSTKGRNRVSDLAHLIKTIAEELDPVMPLQRALIFLLVAETGDRGADMERLARETGLASSSVSRHIMALGKLDRFRKPGLDVVETRVDASDWRRKPVYLTPKGRKVIERLTDVAASWADAGVNNDVRSSPALKFDSRAD